MKRDREVIADRFVDAGIDAHDAGVLPQAQRQLAAECGGGPDGVGLCEECGSRLSRNGGGHVPKPSCWPWFAIHAATHAVSLYRFGRWHMRRVWWS